MLLHYPSPLMDAVRRGWRVTGGLLGPVVGFLAGAGVVLGGAVAARSLAGFVLGFVAPAALVFGRLLRSTDCAYALEAKTRSVEYRRRFGEAEYRTTVCHGSEVELVTLQRRDAPEGVAGYTGRQARLVLVKKDGRLLPVSDFSDFEAEVRDQAAQAAEALRVPMLDSAPDDHLVVTPGVEGPEVRQLSVGQLRRDQHLVLGGSSTRGLALVEEPTALQEERLLAQGVDVLMAALLCLLPAATWLGPRLFWQSALGVSFGEWATTALLLGASLLPAFLLRTRPLEALRVLREGANLSLDRLPDPSRLEDPFVLEFLALEEDRRQTLLEEVQDRSVQCPYCSTPVPLVQAVACLDCETLHHRDCWREALECTTYACGGRRSAPLLEEA